MGKQGPCRHCGVTSTPLWRNGPPEKPVLCNACGSRWRTKGSLDNYFPLHAREPFDAEDFEISEARTICHKPKEEKPHKKKHNYGRREIEYETPYSRIFEGDPSNRSSSGSAISYSGSCAHFGTTDASDLTGSVQSNVRDSLVPSKKRACVSRPKLPPHVEELTRDLHSILQEQQSSYLSASSEELLYDSETPMGSYEIGHGGVLLRYIDSETIEEESEASSLPIDNKSYIASEAYSESASFPVHSESKRISNSNTGIGQVVQEHVQQDTVSHEKIDALRYRSSLLTDADLNDIATFEVFMKCLTHEDRQQLMRDLPAIDTEKPTESLKSMFQSSQFMETLSDFKQLLKEGLFDRSFAGANVEDSRILRKLVLRNLTKSKWVKEYTKLQNVNYNEIIGGKEIAGEENFLAHPRLTSHKRPRGNQNEHYQELRGAIRRPQSVPKSADMNLPSTNTSQMNSSDAVSEVVHDADNFINNEGSCFTLRSMFASPADRSPPLRPLQFNDESSDQDLLLGVARNWSFPEAQLLFPPRNRTVAQSRSQAESGVAGEESLSNT